MIGCGWRILEALVVYFPYLHYIGVLTTKSGLLVTSMAWISIDEIYILPTRTVVDYMILYIK
jgi:hypothetical protein